MMKLALILLAISLAVWCVYANCEENAPEVEHRRYTFTQIDEEKDNIKKADMQKDVGWYQDAICYYLRDIAQSLRQIREMIHVNDMVLPDFTQPPFVVPEYSPTDLSKEER